MDEKMMDEFFTRLDILVKLTALNALAGKKPQDKIKALSEIGLKPSEIAQVLGLKINYITAALSNIRKAETKKKSKKANKPR